MRRARILRASILQPTLHIEDVPLHTHESASLVFVLEGTYRTSADGPVKVSSTPMVIYNPAGTRDEEATLIYQGGITTHQMAASLRLGARPAPGARAETPHRW